MPRHHHNEPDTMQHGLLDLMTSLAVIFILLLAAQITKVSPVPPAPEPAVPASPAVVSIETAPPPRPTPPATTNPNVLIIVIPDSSLHFEFGKSALSPSAEAFLEETLPQYASMLCGPDGNRMESLVIEGYTDDLGDDVRNLRLSQDRSFAVLVKSLEVVRSWLPAASECFERKTSASGRGRQDLVRRLDGQPDRDQSRRVLFKFHLRQT